MFTNNSGLQIALSYEDIRNKERGLTSIPPSDTLPLPHRSYISTPRHILSTMDHLDRVRQFSFLSTNRSCMSIPMATQLIRLCGHRNCFRAWALVLVLTNTIDKAWPSSYTVLTREGESRYEFLGPKYVAYVTSFVGYQNKF